MSRADSTSCLSCHDDALAPGLGLATVPNPEGWRAGHPVRVSYRAAYARDPRSFHRPEAVERLLTLPAGKVECVTCHRPDAENRWTVASTGPGRQLCGSCHRQ